MDDFFRIPRRRTLAERRHPGGWCAVCERCLGDLVRQGLYIHSSIMTDKLRTEQLQDFDPEGPCGPTAFWKISDTCPNEAHERSATRAQLQQGAPPAALEASAAAYLAGVTTGDMENLMALPHMSGGSRTVHLHPYMQTVDDDEDDASGVTELVLGAAGDSIPIVDDILDQ